MEAALGAGIVTVSTTCDPAPAPLLIADIDFVDAGFEACVNKAVIANGWTLASEVIELNCSR